MAGGQTPRPSVHFDPTRSNPTIAPHFDEFVSNEVFFNPQDGHRMIEIRESTDGEFRLTESTLLESEISTWLHQTGNINANSRIRLRLLHLKPRGDYQAIVPLPLSSAAFKEVFKVLGIPHTFLRVLLSNLPIALRFAPNASQVVSNSVGLMLRTDAFSFGQYGMCLIFDPATECTTAVCIGLRASEYEEFLRYVKNRIYAARNCMKLPMLLVDFMNSKTAEWLTNKRLRLQAISKSKEINVREIADDYGFREDENMDLDTATRRLTRLSSEYGIVESISKTHVRFLDFIEEILLECRKAAALGSTSVSADGSEALLDEINFFRESFKSALQYVERDRHGIQSLTQTTYCLIAQKESQRNLMIAEASRAIADESRKVAWWTRRDSTDMRIITAITLIFLPGTFTATLLGSNIFNLNPSDGERVAAPLSWIYWVTTVILTLLVLLAWTLVSRIRNQKQAKELGWEQEMKVLRLSQGDFVAAPGCGRRVSDRGSCEGGCGGCGGD